MNKEQFRQKLAYLNLRESDIDQKWRVYQAEQEEISRRWRIYEEAQLAREAEGEQGEEMTFQDEETAGRNLNPIAVSPSTAGGGSVPSTSYTSADGQTVIEFFKFGGTWRYLILSAETGLPTDLLDTSVADTWGVGWWGEPVQKKGYAIIFYDQDNNDNAIFLPIRGDGTIVGRFQTEWGWNTCDGDGRALTFSYEVPSSPEFGWNVVMFDGEECAEIFLENASDVWIGSDWDSSTIDGVLLANVTYSNGDRTYFALTLDGGAVEIHHFENGPNVWEDVYSYSFASYFVVLVYDQDNNYYIQMKLVAADGTVIEDIDLTYMPLINVNLEFYGTEKVQAIFWSSVPDDPWQLYHYDGSNLIYDTFDRSEHDNHILRAENKYPYYDSEFAPESLAITFYTNAGDAGYNCTFVANATTKFLFTGDEAYQTHVINESDVADVAFNVWSGETTADNISMIVLLNDGNMTLLSLLPSDGIVSDTYRHTTLAVLADMWGGWFDTFFPGNRFGFRWYPDNATNVYMLMDTTGALLDSITTSSSSWVDAGFDLAVVNNYGGDGNSAWYFNNQSGGFVLLSEDFSSLNTDTPWFETEDGLDPGIMLVWIDNTFNFLKSDSISSFTLADEINYNVGKQNLVTWEANEDDQLVITLYDFSGNVANSVTIEDFSSPWYDDMIEDRFFFLFEGEGYHRSVLITPEAVINTVTEDADFIYRAINDYAWWND